MLSLSCAEDKPPDEGETGVQWYWNDVLVLGWLRKIYLHKIVSLTFIFQISKGWSEYSWLFHTGLILVKVLSIIKYWVENHYSCLKISDSN